MFFAANIMQFPYKVLHGDLDFFLTKPINSQFLISIKEIGMGNLLSVSSGVALMTYSWIHLDIPLNFSRFLVAIMFTGIGITLFYSIFMIGAITSIWTKHSEFSSNLMVRLWGLVHTPGTLFQMVPSIIFTYFIPLLIVCTIPVQIFLHKVSLPMLAWAIVITAIWFFACAFFWRFATRYYTSASS